jgi:hypothetical protein
MKKRFISLGLGFALLFLCAGLALSAENKAVTPTGVNQADISNYPLISDEDYYPDGYIGYMYPIRPGMIEWTKLLSGAEMARVSQIPDDILKKMSTEELLQSVLTYPLIGGSYRSNSVEIWLEGKVSTFNGMDELLKRPDFFACLLEIYDDVVETKQESLSSFNSFSGKDQNSADISKYHGALRAIVRGQAIEHLMEHSLRSHAPFET